MSLLYHVNVMVEQFRVVCLLETPIQMPESDHFPLPS